MTPRHYINTEMVGFVVNNSISGIFYKVYAVLCGQFFTALFSVFLEFFKNYFRRSAVD